ATRATVLGREADGNPIASVADYGQGKVFYLGLPLEMTLTRTPGAFHEPEAPACWPWYRHLAEAAMGDRALRQPGGELMLTEHDLAADRRVVVVINPLPRPVQATLERQAGWRLEKVLHQSAVQAGGEVCVTLRANDAAVLMLAR
ncbi:MAG: hypothetical protein HUU35_19170, partial [Armatimonadetes bacterium]|nr:hypothetical protein [Armatimonadota bacterium]